jgi:hypothetical protein
MALPLVHFISIHNYQETFRLLYVFVLSLIVKKIHTFVTKVSILKEYYLLKTDGSLYKNYVVVIE